MSSVSKLIKRNGFSITTFEDGTKLISGPCKSCMALIEDSFEGEGLPDDWYCLSCWTQVERERLKKQVAALTTERDAMATAIQQAIGELEKNDSGKAILILRSALSGIYKDGVIRLREKVTDLERKLSALTALVGARKSPSTDGLRRQNTALMGMIRKLRDQLDIARMEYVNLGSTQCAERLLDIALNGRSGGIFGGAEVEACAQEIEGMRNRITALELALRTNEGELIKLQRKLKKETANRATLERAFATVRDHASRHEMSDIVFLLEDSLYG